MASELKNPTGRSSVIIPFADTIKFSKSGKTKLVYDFIYVATGEPHKNHKRLIEAWKILGRDGIKPSLCLTIDPKVDTNISQMDFQSGFGMESGHRNCWVYIIRKNSAILC